eukprot:scaffold3185_cov161-Amphora_coffeaeformis.AAC.6
MPSRRRRGLNVFRPTLAGIVNADAMSDEQARRRVWHLFGSILGLLFVVDTVCSLMVVILQCHSNEGGDGEEDVAHVARCVRRSLLYPAHNNEDSDKSKMFGDLFLLALTRVAVTSLLLSCGVYWGKPSRRHHQEEEEEPQTTATTTSTTTPNSSAGALTEPLLEGGNEENSGPAETSSEGARTRRYCGCKPKSSPERVNSIVLVALFVTSTFYQVYAGFRVARLEHATEAVTCLLCLTVLWINAQAYVFRVLLAELTREKGLFLPPEVHRHPMYYCNAIGMSFHSCDLCHQGMPNGQACYRCSMCDFDVCLKCSKRSDAAIVGENVLRGDRGVRVQQTLTNTDYVKRTIQMAQRELPLLVVSFILLASSSVSQLLLPHFQGHIIDKVIPDAQGNYDKVGFMHFIQIYIGVMVAQGALSTLYSAIFTLVSRRLKFTIRNALLEKILNQDIAYFDGTESGRLISHLTNDLNMMMEPIQSSMSSLLSNVLILFGGLVMCFMKSYRLSMLAFVTVGPITALWEQYAQWSKGLAREMLSHWADGNSIASQALSHVRTVKAFGCEEKVMEKYSKANKHALDCGVKDAWGNGLTSALTGYLDLGTGVLILWYGGLLVFRGEISVGVLVTFQLYFNMMNNSYQNLQGLVTQFTRSAAGAEKVFSLWDSDPDINPKEGNDVDWDVQGHLQLQDVLFYYQMRSDNIVLNKLSLDIPAGKTVALVGRSGGGKSTIISLLLRFYDPRGGKLMLDGKDFESLKVGQLRRLFGVVTQETELFALTVEENIAYGLDKDDYTMDDVINAAKKAYAHEFISEMKDGYQTRIGERGNRLSGGQRQRIAIARVFLRRPKIILLDEATSALDENSQELVQEALANLIAESNATVVLVAHRLSTVQNADSICVIDKGTVLEQGNHDELLALGGIYSTMVQKQHKKKTDQLDQEKVKTYKKEKAADDIDALLEDN